MLQTLVVPRPVNAGAGILTTPTTAPGVSVQRVLPAGVAGTVQAVVVAGGAAGTGVASVPHHITVHKVPRLQGVLVSAPCASVWLQLPQSLPVVAVTTGAAVSTAAAQGAVQTSPSVSGFVSPTTFLSTLSSPLTTPRTTPVPSAASRTVNDDEYTQIMQNIITAHGPAASTDTLLLSNGKRRGHSTGCSELLPVLAVSNQFLQYLNADSNQSTATPPTQTSATTSSSTAPIGTSPSSSTADSSTQVCVLPLFADCASSAEVPLRTRTLQAQQQTTLPDSTTSDVDGTSVASSTLPSSSTRN